MYSLLKKSLIVSLITLICFSFVSCNKGEQNPQKEPNNAVTQEDTIEGIDIKILAMNGPTGMGLARLIEQSEEGNTVNNYTLELASSPEDVLSKAVKNEADIICMPSNMSSILYNKAEGAHSVLAANTLGVLYIVETGDEINSIEDLKGKSIYASGQGATPQYSLEYLLDKYGIKLSDVDIQWKSEHSEVLASMMADSTNSAIGLLPQPFVTIASAKLPSMKIALDLNQIWDELDNDSSIITGVAVASKKFIEENRAQIDVFLEEYQKSVDFTNENPENTGVLIEKYAILPNAKIAQQAIPYCNITCMTGDELKKNLVGYLKVLYDANPKSIGGAMPDEEFIYISQK